MYLLHENKNIRGYLNLQEIYRVFLIFTGLLWWTHLSTPQRMILYARTVENVWKVDRLRQHLKQEMKFKFTTDLAQQHFVKMGSYWLIRPAMVNKNVSHVITVTTNCQRIAQSSWGRDSSTCSERIISSGLLTFFIKFI